MTRQERARFVGRKLDEFFPDVDAPLDHGDPFTLLVAVVLSAQCTDKRVNLVTPALFKRADTPMKMAKVPVPEIRSLIRTCGLSSTKARNIQALSRLLLERHGGQVPRTFAELEELPGVGHKTASVVMAHAFEKSAFPVDTHIHRLAKRWKLSRGRNVVETERDLKELFAESDWYKRHLQIIFYGRKYCSARGCDGRTCPICSALRGLV